MNRPTGPLPRKGTVIRIRVRKKNAFGRHPLTLFVDGVVLGTNNRGLLMLDSHNRARLFRTPDILDYTPFCPNQNDGPFFTGQDMADHIRQTGRPPVDMISNPDPRESGY